jgi:hypothetical protein
MLRADCVSKTERDRLKMTDKRQALLEGSCTWKKIQQPSHEGQHWDEGTRGFLPPLPSLSHDPLWLSSFSLQRRSLPTWVAPQPHVSQFLSLSLFVSLWTQSLTWMSSVKALWGSTLESLLPQRSHSCYSFCHHLYFEGSQIYFPTDFSPGPRRVSPNAYLVFILGYLKGIWKVFLCW